VGPASINAVVSRRDGFVALGTIGSDPDTHAAIWRSRDGIHWAQVPATGIDDKEGQQLIATRDRLVALTVSGQDGFLRQSTDGGTWTPVSTTTIPLFIRAQLEAVGRDVVVVGGGEPWAISISLP
jgi:hypothetical protein